MFELTCQLATMQPPPPEMRELLGAVHGNQRAMDGFVIAGTVPPPEFFGPQNAAQIMAEASAQAVG